MITVGSKVRVRADTEWHDVPILKGDKGTVIHMGDDTAWVQLDGPEKACAELSLAVLCQRMRG